MRRSYLAAVAMIVGCGMTDHASADECARFPDADAARPARASEADGRSYPGHLDLVVDARDTDHALFRISETIPVERPGPMTLLYPEWELSSHGRTVSAANLAGLGIDADGVPLAWRRDPQDPHAFHLDVPTGARTVHVAFQYLTRLEDGIVSDDRIRVAWQHLVLYPSGWPVRCVPVDATLLWPKGLASATALPLAERTDGRARVGRVALGTLLDTPVVLARHLRTIVLPYGHDGTTVRFDLIAADEAGLAVPDDESSGLRRMLAETYAVFGRAPYRSFDALIALDDDLAPGGFEHVSSTEVNLPAAYFTQPDRQLNNRDLIAHEHVHAWNGRFRVPADADAATPNTPLQNSLLWVYEGQTEFWGRVLAARSGMRTMAQTRDKLAMDAASVQLAVGRRWKDLEDTTNDPLYLSGRALVWPEWQRRKDYYGEGVLLWLTVHARLQDLSHGTMGIDRFARTFFDVASSKRTPSPYTLDDICATLARWGQLDWRAYLEGLLHAKDARVLDGLDRLGWTLAFADRPTDTFAQDEAESGATDLRYSVGLSVDDKGRLRTVVWDGPGFKAGLAPGERVVRVGTSPFSTDALLRAVAASSDTPVALTVERAGKRREVTLDYHGGARYPVLRRIDGRPDRLTTLLAPRSGDRGGSESVR